MSCRLNLSMNLNSSKDPASSDRESFTLLALTACILTALLFVKALYIQYPIVFGDEAVYALQAKYLKDPHLDRALPNLLFLYLYHTASWFGRDHIEFSKFLNSTFFGLSFFPLYLTGRRFLSSRGAYLFAIGVVLSPIDSYSVYMTPESMYFFVFWVVTYILVGQLTDKPVRGGLWLGFALAALTEVKPHAFILVGPILIIFVDMSLRGRRILSFHQILYCGLACSLALVVGRLIITHLAGANSTIDVAGKFYGRPLHRAMTEAHSSVWPMVGFLIEGHLIYLALLFWPPIILIVWPITAEGRPLDKKSIGLESLAIVCLVSIGLIVPVASTFVAKLLVLNPVPGEMCRVHARYYDFAFPALVLLFLARTAPDAEPRRWPGAFKIVVICGAIIAGLLACYRAANYCPHFVDFPELSAIPADEFHIAFLVVGCLGPAACLAFVDRRTARVCYCVFIGVVAFAGSIDAFNAQRASTVPPSEVDLAAISVRGLIASSQVDDGVVIAKTQDLRMERALFHLYSRSQQKMVKHPVLIPGDVPSGTKWALLLDPYLVDIPFYSKVEGRGYEFLQLAPGGTLTATAGSKSVSYPRTYNLSGNGEQSLWLSGFNPQENWGVWTRDQLARVYFAAPISGNLRIRIKGRGYGPNATRPVELRIGGFEQSATFSDTVTEVDMKVNLPAQTYFLEFSGMTPVSPKSLGRSEDSRPLGLGLLEIQIDQVSNAPNF